MDASEIYSKRLNAKEVIFPKEKGEFTFPIADGRTKHLGGDQDLRTSTSIRQRPIRAESHLVFLGEGLFHHLKTRFRMPVKRQTISGPQNARRFGTGQWSFLRPGSEKKWHSISADSPQGEWDTMAEKMMLEFGESRHPVFRATSPLSRGKLRSKGHGKLSSHYCADQATIETICRIIVSANQLSLYGAVANMCEECESLHDRSGQPDKVMGQ